MQLDQARGRCASQARGSGSLSHPGHSVEPELVPQFWKDPPWVSLSPALPFTVVLGEEGLASPDLEMTRTPS